MKWKIEEVHFVGFLCKLLETKIMQVLRFKHGQVLLCLIYIVYTNWAIPAIVFHEFLLTHIMLQIYSVGVSVFLGGNKPSRSGDVRGDISVNFSCDPDMPWKLVGLCWSNQYF